MAKYRKVLPHDKEQVINLYCAKMSMRAISDRMGLSKTKVFDILHEANSPDNQIFLRHDLAVNLYKNGITLREYADLIRAKNILIRHEIQTEKILASILEVTELCFKISLGLQTLVTSFNNFRQFVSSIAGKSPENLGTRLEFELKYLESIVEDVNVKMDKCKQLRTQIDILERSAGRSRESTGKH